MKKRFAWQARDVVAIRTRVRSVREVWSVECGVESVKSKCGVRSVQVVLGSNYFAKAVQCKVVLGS